MLALLNRPAQPVRESLAHDPFFVAGREKVQFLGEQRDVLPVGNRRLRQVGAPHDALRAEVLRWIDTLDRI